MGNLDRGQYPFQPIKFVNLVVPSPCETEPLNKQLLDALRLSLSCIIKTEVWLSAEVEA